MRIIRCTLVGDTQVGKTSLIYSFIYGSLYGHDILQSCNSGYAKNVFIEDKKYRLNLEDTRGSDDFKNIRHLKYIQVDIVIICFSIDDRDSFDNVRTIWSEEVKAHCNCEHTVIILLGTKLDLRESKESTRPVLREEGIQMAKEIGASKYIEFSAFKESGTDVIFDTAVKSWISKNSTIKKKKSKCAIL